MLLRRNHRCPPPLLTRQLHGPPPIRVHMQNALLCGFDFVMAPLVHPRYRRPAPTALPRGTFLPPFTRSDLLLSSSQWAGQVVGKVSPWIDCDSPSPALARDSAAALQQELAWAAHLSLQAVVLPPPPQPLNAANYARILNQVPLLSGNWVGPCQSVTAPDSESLSLEGLQSFQTAGCLLTGAVVTSFHGRISARPCPGSNACAGVGRAHLHGPLAAHPRQRQQQRRWHRALGGRRRPLGASRCRQRRRRRGACADGG